MHQADPVSALPWTWSSGGFCILSLSQDLRTPEANLWGHRVTHENRRAAGPCGHVSHLAVPPLAGHFLLRGLCTYCSFFLVLQPPLSLFFLINLFLAVMGLHCCKRVFSSCGKQGAMLHFQCSSFSLWWLLLFWPPDAKSKLIGKEPDAGKNWRQKEKRAAEDEMVR